MDLTPFDHPNSCPPVPRDKAYIGVIVVGCVLAVVLIILSVYYYLQIWKPKHTTPEKAKGKGSHVARPEPHVTTPLNDDPSFEASTGKPSLTGGSSIFSYTNPSAEALCWYSTNFVMKSSSPYNRYLALSLMAICNNPRPLNCGSLLLAPGRGEGGENSLMRFPLCP